LIGAIHKIPWKFSCYQCYVICFLWLFKTNHHRFSSIYLCLDFWLWSSTRLSCYVSSSPLLSSCYISTKNVYQVKHGKPQLPKRLEEKHILIYQIITIQQFRHWALPSIYWENPSNAKQDISLSNLWVTRNSLSYCRTKFKTTSFLFY
jgi:hypothetical protein